MPAESPDLDRRVLLLAPTSRDADATRALLGSMGIHCMACPTLEHLCNEVPTGAAVAIVPEEALQRDNADLLGRCLRQQPVWSDLPVIVLSSAGAASSAIDRALATLGDVNVLERPVRVSTFTSMVKSAMRARERQYQVRDNLERRRRSEEELRRSHDTFYHLIQNNPFGVYVVDADFRLRQVSLGSQKVFAGITPLLGRDFAEVLRAVWPEPFASEAIARFRHTLETGEPFVAPSTIERREGTDQVEAYDWRIERVTLPEGRFGVVCYFYDLSERLRLEAAIRQSELRLRLALGAARMVVWEFDPATGKAVVSDGAAELYGLAPGETLNTHEQGFALVHPDDVPEQRARFTKALEEGEGYSAQFRMVRRDDGKVVWVEERAQAIRNDAGQVERLIGVHIDITEQKRAEAAMAESEAKFRQLAETIPQLAWMANRDGWISWYNRRWHQYTGTTPQQMEGWGWQSVHDPAELPRVIEGWQRSISTGEPFEMEFPLRGADGQFRWFLTRAAPLRDSEGNITLWFGTNTDIEDKRRIAEERAHLLEAEREARTEAERASRMKDEFLATLSHELRTPLNAILGWSQILAGGSRDADDLSEGLRIIERNARAQTQIIEDLLDMSRIISGKVRLDVQHVDLASVIHGAIESVRPSADAKGIRLQAVLDPFASPVSGDPNRLQQVMWNLLTNAIKFTPRGGRVHVRLERVDSQLDVTVSDTGEGIKPEFLPYVFDRFRQADATTTRRHGGLGLGLAIVKQLVELHGGSISVRSAGAGSGTTFKISLPLTVTRAEGPAESKRHHPVAAPQPAIAADLSLNLAGVKVLVVDDEPDARTLLRRLLEDCEAVVTTASSAAEAVTLIQSRPPDVLVSDIGMPVADGYALIQQVRALGPERGGDVPAVALTAYARSEDRMRSVRAGFQMHIAKPVEPAELITMVASLAGRTGKIE